MVRMIFVLLAISATGCATKLKMTYDSDPPGAVIYYNGERLGYAPQTITFDVDRDEEKQGYIEIWDAQASWTSGASTKTGDLKIRLSRGYAQQLLLTRPKGAPGYDIDARFALELARTRAAQRMAEAQEAQARAQQAQARAQQAQAEAQARQAAAQEQRNRTENSRGNAPLYCTSQVIAGTISTSCY